MKKDCMNHIPYMLLIIYVLGILVGGCSGDMTLSGDDKFTTILSVGDLNHGIRLSKVDIDGYRDRNSFVIMMKNRTDSLIVFPKDYGIQLYQYTNNEWIDIPNKMVYLTDENVILSPKGHPLGLSESDIPFSPDLPNLQQPISIRLAVIGNIQQPDGSLGEAIGAYIDIMWEP